MTSDATIVHLSDLHFKNDARNKFRLKSLRADLERLTADGPLYTAFTGDLVHAGDDDAFHILFDELIGPLIGLGHEVFIVPGNHDVQRSRANAEFTRSILGDRDSSYLFSARPGFRTTHPKEENDPLIYYRNLEDLLAPYDHTSYLGYLATRQSVTVLGLNSAWLCCTRPDGQSDRGALRVEPAVLEAYVKSMPTGTVRIALIHHPLDWLEENTRSAVHDLLIKNVDLVLYGHVHANDVIGQTKGTSSCLFLQAPPLRADWSKGSNGYSIIRANVKNKRFEVEFRAYSEPRREFVVGEDFAASGRLYPRPEDAAFYRATPSLSSLLVRYGDAAPYDYLDWYRTHIRAKSKVTGSFVEPKVSRVASTDEGSMYGPSQQITEVVKLSTRDMFFIAPLDAGSTTAAYIVFKYLSEQFILHRKVPAYFDASRETINKASILRKISQTNLGRYSHSEIEQLVVQGSVVVIVDGLCLGDVEQFNLFRDTAQRHLPDVRFIYFLSTERRGISSTGAGVPRLSIEEDEVYEFAQLDVGDIRSMIDMRVPDASAALREGMVGHVVECFRQMDEPIFASTVAVVLDTLTQDPEFRPINKARLIERYVECLLGRFDLEDVREGTFASSDKINYLGYFARQLLESQMVGVNEADWSRIESEYQARFLIELPRNLLDEFIGKGILTMDGGCITFRGDHLFSFFVAHQMKADPVFAESLVYGAGLFRHFREINVYGELEGINISHILDILFAQLGEIETIILENYSRAGIDLTNEWKNACAEMDSEVAAKSFEDAATDLGEANPSLEGADRHDNAELAQIERRRGVAERHIVREAEARLLVGMRLYALLLKNALHLEAKDKIRHFIKLLEAGELWLGFMCAERDSIGRRPLVMAGGVQFINYIALVDADRSYREFKFIAPNTVSKLFASILRNPQLGIVIRSIIPQLSPISRLFARDIVLGMPSTVNREAYLASLKDETDLNLVTCALRMLRSKYLASGRNHEAREHYDLILKGIMKDRRVSSRVDIEKLRKARIVQDLRSKAAEGRK